MPGPAEAWADGAGDRFDNRVVLSGVLLTAPEIRVAPSGLSVVTLELEHVSRTGGEPLQRLELRMPVVVVGPLAAQCRSLTPGTVLSVQGRLNQKRWIRDEKVRWGRTELVATHLQVLEGDASHTG